MGMLLLTDFVYDGNNLWNDGTIYDPDSGKTYSCKIIISAATYEQVKDRITARYLGCADLKGKVDKIEIYEPLGFLNS